MREVDLDTVPLLLHLGVSDPPAGQFGHELLVVEYSTVQ